MRGERLEDLFLVEQSVDEIGVAFGLIDKARVDDLQDHPQHLLQNGDVGQGLPDRRVLLDACLKVKLFISFTAILPKTVGKTSIYSIIRILIYLQCLRTG